MEWKFYAQKFTFFPPLFLSCTCLCWVMSEGHKQKVVVLSGGSILDCTTQEITHFVLVSDITGLPSAMVDRRPAQLSA